MSGTTPSPERYRVAYSERARRRLLTLADVAQVRGDGVFEERRLVMVAALPVLLPRSESILGD